MRRVPGVHVLSMEPRSLGVAGASFIRRKKKKLPDCTRRVGNIRL